MPSFYLTTAIDYSNGDPHLGHALEKVGADAIARYRRLRGDDVRFLMGMDEHSQAVIQAAEREGYTPHAWVDRMAERFETFWRRLECSNDDWIRTTEPRHREAVTELLRRIQHCQCADRSRLQLDRAVQRELDHPFRKYQRNRHGQFRVQRGSELRSGSHRHHKRRWVYGDDQSAGIHGRRRLHGISDRDRQHGERNFDSSMPEHPTRGCIRCCIHLQRHRGTERNH